MAQGRMAMWGLAVRAAAEHFHPRVVRAPRVFRAKVAAADQTAFPQHHAAPAGGVPPYLLPLMFRLAVPPRIHPEPRVR